MLFFSRAQLCVFEKKDLGAVFVEIDYRFQFRVCIHKDTPAAERPLLAPQLLRLARQVV